MFPDQPMSCPTHVWRYWHRTCSSDASGLLYHHPKSLPLCLYCGYNNNKLSPKSPWLVGISHAQSWVFFFCTHITPAYHFRLKTCPSWSEYFNPRGPFCISWPFTQLWTWKAGTAGSIRNGLTIHIWLVVEPPLWKISVSWDSFSQYMVKFKNVPTHQPDSIK